MTATDTPAQTDRLLDMKELATRLGLSVLTLKWWRKCGRWPSELRLIDIGSGVGKSHVRWRVRASDLESYLARRTVA